MAGHRQSYIDAGHARSTSEYRGAGVGGDPTGSKVELIVGNTFCSWCGDANNPGVFDSGPSSAALGDKTASYGGGGTPAWDFDVVGFLPGGVPTPQDEFLAQDYGGLGIIATDDDTKNEIMQVAIGGSWINDGGGAITQIDFGYTHTEQEYNSRGGDSGFLGAGFWEWSAGVWPDDVWVRESSAGILSEFGGGPAVDYYWTVPIETGLDVVETVQVAPCTNPGCDNVSNGNVFWPGWGSISGITGADYTDEGGTRGRAWSGGLGDRSIVDEKIDAFYLQMSIEDEFNGMPFNALLGLRYEDSETESWGTDSPPSGVSWNNANEWTYISGSSRGSFGGGSTKTYLPSLDIDMEVIEDLVARFSYGRSLARPNIESLRSIIAFPGTPNVGTRIIDEGNPQLRPYLSDNLDLSVEWYYDSGSYASVGYFIKRIDDYIVTNTTQVTAPELDLRDPQLGARAEVARAELINAGIPVTNQSLFDQINANLGNTVPPLPPILEAGDDPLMQFNLNKPVNEEKANLYGWEFAFQHMFGDTGWGVQANATVVNGNVNADPNLLVKQFALTGLSDSANFTVFYENDIISARVAYNWRDDFLGDFDEFEAPVFTEAYQQIDANVTWNVNDNLAAFFEVINLTEETLRQHIRYKEQFRLGAQYGARFNIGARYNFD